MTSEAPTPHAMPQPPPRRNTGLHGAFWTRCLLKFMRFVPKRAALVLVWPVTWVIYVLATPQRQAILSNLAALRPEHGPVQRWWAGYYVFLNFALTYLDRLWCMYFKKQVTWEVSHMERFEELRAHPGGVIIFTIHSGNYDIGAKLFAQKFGRRLHTVRAPEQTEELQKLREQELRRTEQESPLLHVHYNCGDNHLGLELCRVLMDGDAVAVQGDRVLSAVSPVAMSCEGRTYQIPRGPLVLAEISKAPCYPIFLERISCLRYRIHVGECFSDGASRLRADDIGRRWLPILHHHLQNHWDQWFVFEPLVTLEETKRP